MAGEEVADAFAYERRAMVAFASVELGERQPVRRDDTLVELASRFDARGAPAEAESQERHVLRGVMPAIDADERFRLEMVRGLLEHLAAAGVDQRFTRIEMARGLVEDQPAVDPLLDQKELPVALDHGRDGHAGLPDHAALRVFF